MYLGISSGSMKLSKPVRIKFISMGEAGVGKSCLIKR